MVGANNGSRVPFGSSRVSKTAKNTRSYVDRGGGMKKPAAKKVTKFTMKVAKSMKKKAASTAMKKSLSIQDYLPDLCHCGALGVLKNPKKPKGQVKRPGVHYLGQDDFYCSAGGGEENLWLQVDLDFGSFPMPTSSFRRSKKTRKIPRGKSLLGHLGHEGVELREYKISVKAMKLEKALDQLDAWSFVFFPKTSLLMIHSG